MEVGVDQGPKRFGAFEPGIEFDTQFPRQREIRPLACAADDAIDGAEGAAGAIDLALDDKSLAFRPDAGDGEALDQADAACLDEGSQALAEVCLLYTSPSPRDRG